LHSSPSLSPHLAALSGLLHDIGKFWQRAEKRGVHEAYRDFDRTDYGVNGAHATFSAAFVEQFVPAPFRQISAAILFHHNPQDEHARRLALADRLAAANERQKSMDQHPKALISVFSTIGATQTERHYVPLHSLKLTSAALFPTTNANAGEKEYQALWKEFTHQAQQLSQETDLATYVEALQGLMQRYCWCIPSGSEPDVSLYDHSRVTAALAACLNHTDDTVVKRLLGSWDKTPIATFVEGDLSGIQRFIYTIPANGAARQLRARSLYLQLLTDAIARFILRQFDIPPTNLIYSGGGRFYLLLPANTDLQPVREQIDELLLKHHDGDLYIALGQAELAAQDFMPERFQQKWSEVGQSIAQNKRRRFGQMSPADIFNRVFEPRGYYGDHEFSKRRDDRENPVDEEDWEPYSVFGSSLDTFGRTLPRANFILLGEVKPQEREPGSFQAVLNELGTSVILLDDEGQWKRPDRIGSLELDRAIVMGMQQAPDEGILAIARQHFNCPVAGRIRYTVNVIPEKSDGSTADFTELQQSSKGLKRIGVLRMDVDDLGRLFASGFHGTDDKSRASLARVASLSFALSLYFEGYVGELCRRMNEKYRQEDEIEAVYAVYSGGDDLFIVGRWDVLPELADQIRTGFGNYACNNPEVHISAGITLHGGKYPLYRAAEEASDALDSAKSLPGKDGICFLGQPLKWRQWEDVLVFRDELLDLTSTGNVKRSLIQTLLQLHTDYVTALQETRKTRTGEQQLAYGPWLWRSAYQFTRIAERSGADKKRKEHIQRLHEGLKKDNFKGIALAGITARWVDALTRKERQMEEEQ
jgi:CRISPR-associated protein Csm1